MSGRHLSVVPNDEVIARLRSTVDALEGRAQRQVYPVPEALAPLLPDGGLRAGATYRVQPGALLLALLAMASQAELWCGVVGMPELGVEAAALAGVTLERLALVPEPGERWLAVTAALADVVPVLAVRPTRLATQAEALRLAGRLRDKGTALLVDGPWPGVEASLSVSEPQWSGVGEGWGYLTERAVTVRVAAKRYAGEATARVVLPGADGRMRPPRLGDGEPGRREAGAGGPVREWATGQKQKVLMDGTDGELRRAV